MSSPRKNANTRPRRFKVKTIVFETDFFFRPKCRRLVKLGGLEAPALFLAAICYAAYEEDDLILKDTSIETLAEDIGTTTERLTEVLDYCCDAKIKFFSRVEGGYCSERLLREAGALEEKQNNYVEAAKAREEAKRLARQNGSAHPTKTEQDVPKLTKIETRFGPSTKSAQVCKEQELEQEYDHDHDLDLDPERDLASPKPPNPTYMAHALAMLRTDRFPGVTEDPRHVGAGRLPMIDYPLIWITPGDLVQVMEDYDRDKIPSEYRKDAFQLVQKRFEEWVEDGKRIVHINPQIWLLGFAKNKVLENVAKSADAQRSQVYLRKATS